MQGTSRAQSRCCSGAICENFTEVTAVTVYYCSKKSGLFVTTHSGSFPFHLARFSGTSCYCWVKCCLCASIVWHEVCMKIAVVFLLVSSARCLSNFLSKQQLDNKPFHRLISHKTLRAIEVLKISPHLWYTVCNRFEWGLHLWSVRKVVFTGCTSLQRNILCSSKSN